VLVPVPLPPEDVPPLLVPPPFDVPPLDVPPVDELLSPVLDDLVRVAERVWVDRRLLDARTVRGDEAESALPLRVDERALDFLPADPPGSTPLAVNRPASSRDEDAFGAGMPVLGDGWRAGGSDVCVPGLTANAVGEGPSLPPELTTKAPATPPPAISAATTPMATVGTPAPARSRAVTDGVSRSPEGDSGLPLPSDLSDIGPPLLLPLLLIPTRALEPRHFLCFRSTGEIFTDAGSVTVRHHLARFER
jgi:hypothetical protein